MRAEVSDGLGALMRLGAILAIIIATLTMAAQDSYFPNGALSDDDRVGRFKVRWYSDQLRALNEPSLLDKAKNPSLQSYRFVWLRTFNHPVAVRLDITSDGAGKLTVKIADGAGGYKPGKLIEDTSPSVTQEQVEKFLEQLKNAGF
jgi:hypothetical protein